MGKDVIFRHTTWQQKKNLWWRDHSLS